MDRAKRSGTFRPIFGRKKSYGFSEDACLKGAHALESGASFFWDGQRKAVTQSLNRL
jgi:hypothetical protein